MPARDVRLVLGASTGGLGPDLVVAILSLVVAVSAAWAAYLALYPSRRELIYGIESMYRLLNTPPDPAATPGNEIRVYRGEDRLRNPFVVEYSLVCSGRSDIERSDFDGREPLVVSFDCKLVADLTAGSRDQRLQYEIVEAADAGFALRIGPTLLRRGRAVPLHAAARRRPGPVAAADRTPLPGQRVPDAAER